MTKKRGFTLIEILAVIGVIGILILIGVLAFRAYQPTLQLSGTVRQLITDLREVQQMAVTQQIDHGIRFFVAEDKYQILSYENGTEEILVEKKLPGSVSFQQIGGLTDNQAVFNPYGAIKNEPGTVILINIKNETTAVDIRPSGFVKIIN